MSRWRSVVEGDAPLRRQRPDQCDDVLHDVGDSDRFGRERQVPRLDAGEIEDLIDQIQQVRAAFEDMQDAVVLRRVQPVRLEQLREPEDRI